MTSRSFSEVHICHAPAWMLLHCCYDIYLLSFVVICCPLTRSRMQEGKYLTMVCQSFGRLGVRGPLWQQLGERVKERVDWLAPVDMALMLGRSSSFGEMDEPWEELTVQGFCDLRIAHGFGKAHSFASVCKVETP